MNQETIPLEAITHHREQIMLLARVRTPATIDYRGLTRPGAPRGMVRVQRLIDAVIKRNPLVPTIGGSKEDTLNCLAHLEAWVFNLPENKVLPEDNEDVRREFQQMCPEELVLEIDEDDDATELDLDGCEV